MRQLTVFGVAFMCALAIRGTAAAQSSDTSMELVVNEGTPLRVALDRRTVIKKIGQPVTATLIDAVYAYDRIVLPAGSKVSGHVESITGAGKRARAAALLAGDFTPTRRIGLQFDRVALTDGRELTIQTVTIEGAENVVLRAAGESNKNSVGKRVRDEVARQVKDATAVFTAPGRGERFKDAMIRALPYHRQFLRKGTVFTARITEPLAFGSVTPAPRASAGALPAPESILRARLTTGVVSGTSPQGTPIVAVLTQPVSDAEGRLILPAGTKLTGEVTFSKAARHFRRNGQLRFLFEAVQAPDQGEQQLLASLFAVETPQAAAVKVDEEGGVTSTNSKARFAAPALAALALVGSTHGRLDYDTDGAGPEMQYGGAVTGTVGGFMGLGLFGIGVNQLGTQVTIVTASYGVARTVYSTIFARGREVVFPVDTAIQVQLAPGPVPPSQR